MSKIKTKGGALLAPVPAVLVSCGTMEKSNILTVAWTGIINSDPPMTYISVRPERYSYPIIKQSGEFVINLVTKELTAACDWCGVRSGKDYDKFAETKLTPQRSFELSCPSIAQSPLSIECKVRKSELLGSHEMFIADILSISIDESLVDESGRFRIEECGLTAYAHGQYFSLGDRLGSFGYTVRKKK